MAARAVIFGCGGTTLTPEELRFFTSRDPWGFILFARNVENPEQLRALTDSLRQAVGRDAPVLIDQEGGRVARLRGPHWREWEPALDECQHFSDIDARARAMRLRYRLMAGELRSVGIDVNCAPVLDLVQEYSHAVLKNRCYGPDMQGVAITGRAVAEGLMEGGVLPVIKHMPGQGRADLDSHMNLPVVSTTHTELTNTDFAPFRALADLPMAMSAHVIYSDIDPTAPATLSPRMNVIMRQEIGFDGLLMTDDLSMHALTGPFGKRAENALAAGCDVVLHCNGDPNEMVPVADAVPLLEGRSLERANAALALRQDPQPADFEALEAEYAELRERTVHA